MIPCNDCIYEKTNTAKSIIKCFYCHRSNYNNYKSRNKRKLLIILMIPYLILLVGFMGLWILR